MSSTITPVCCRSYFSSNGSQDCHSPSLSGRPSNYTTIKALSNMDQPDKLFLRFRQRHGISWATAFSGKNIPKASSSSSSSSSPQDTSPKSPWQKWLLGIVLTVVLPAAAHKGGLLIALKAKIDETIGIVDSMAETVEEIAEEADKLVAQVEEKLPDDSKFKETLESFEDLTKVAVKQARKAEDLIHQVKDSEEQIASVLIDNNNDKAQN